MLIGSNANNDKITLIQSGLAQKFFEALDLDDNTSFVETPVDSYLPLNADGELIQELFNYAPLLAC